MAKSIFISYARENQEQGALVQQQLQAAGYRTFFDTKHLLTGAAGEQEIRNAVRRSLAVVVLVSPDSAASEWVMNECSLARQYRLPLLPLLIFDTPVLPWYLQDIQVQDCRRGIDGPALERLLSSLPEPDTGVTFGDGRDAYLQRATLKSPHTVSSYHRAIELFLEFLTDRHGESRLPIQQIPFLMADEILLSQLSDEDAPIFLHFAQWLLSPGSGKSGDGRPYKASTVLLRLAGVQNWFQFLDDYGWLPSQFHLAKARRIVRDELRSRPQRSGPAQPPDDIEEVIYFYDHQELPRALQKPDVDPARIERWQLNRQRNCALLHSLAETGGRISEILSLNLDDFPERYLNRQEVLRVEVTGKGGHIYPLRFLDALPTIRAYIHARGANLRASSQGHVPLFVSHDPHYEGHRMSRVVAWRVVQRAARALGLRDITPHDFRHWRATQLLNAGHPIDVVQDYLGHRSVETTRAYYARTDPLRVDDAAKNTRLPDPGES